VRKRRNASEDDAEVSNVSHFFETLNGLRTFQLVGIAYENGPTKVFGIDCDDHVWMERIPNMQPLQQMGNINCTLYCYNAVDVHNYFEGGNRAMLEQGSAKALASYFSKKFSGHPSREMQGVRRQPIRREHVDTPGTTLFETGDPDAAGVAKDMDLEDLVVEHDEDEKEFELSDDEVLSQYQKDLETIEALIDRSECPLGKLEAKPVKKRKIELVKPIPPKMVWAMPHHVVRNFHRRHKIVVSDGVVMTTALVKVGDENVVINGELRLTRAESKEMTTDGAFVRVTEEETFKPLSDHFTLEARILHSIESVSTKLVDLRGPLSMTRQLNAVRGFYVRFYPDDNRFDRMCTALLTSPSVRDSVWKLHDCDNLFRLREEAAFHNFAVNGRSREWVIDQLRSRVFNAKAKYLAKSVLTLGVYACRNKMPTWTDTYRALITSASPLGGESPVLVRPCTLRLAKSTSYACGEPKRVQNLRVENREPEAAYVDIFGATVEGVGLVYPDSGPLNKKAAVLQRLDKPKISDDAKLEKFLTFARDWIDHNCPAVHLDYGGEEEFIRSHYPPKQAMEMIECLERPCERDDFISSMFVKREVYVGKFDNGSVDPDQPDFKPRVIISKKRRALARFTHAYHQVEKAFKMRFPQYSTICYSGAVTPASVGAHVEWMDSLPGEWYEGDHDDYDSSQAKAMVQLEGYYLMTKVTGWRDEHELSLLCDSLGESHVRTPDISYDIDYSRESGSRGTSSFNFLVNLLKILFCMQPTRIATIISGDDNLNKVETNLTVEQIEQNFRELGVVTKLFKRQS
jgi:hypothetical protein